ncbi:MAG: hypothetical protein IPG67_15895 [Acidobacteria bacterium]|nr:hypothetical protein [Acidobacteriota bacterium]
MRNKAAGLIAVGILALVSLGCLNTSTTTVKGVVWNYDKPVEGATVTFGPTLGEVSAVTGKDGKFELTVKHRFTAMLYVKAPKPGLGQREKVEFPGFAAPDEEVKVEMIAIIGGSK